MVYSIFSGFSLSKARRNLFRLQRRIFKSVIVGDLVQAFRIQKILVISHSSRLLAIRYVTQDKSLSLSYFSTGFPLSFNDKFNLNYYLLNNVFDWKPQKFFNVDLFDKSSNSSRRWSAFDSCWQCLVKFAIEPAEEAVFSPRSFGFRAIDFSHIAQRLILLNLSKDSFGLQKRVLLINFHNYVNSFDYNKFFKKLLVPRFIKIGIFRFLKLGFLLGFEDKLSSYSLNSLLANVLFNGIEFSSNSVRFGSKFLIFLKPADDEVFILNNVSRFFAINGIDKVYIFLL